MSDEDPDDPAQLMASVQANIDGGYGTSAAAERRKPRANPLTPCLQCISQRPDTNNPRAATNGPLRTARKVNFCLDRDRREQPLPFLAFFSDGWREINAGFGSMCGMAGRKPKQ